MKALVYIIALCLGIQMVIAMERVHSDQKMSRSDDSSVMELSDERSEESCPICLEEFKNLLVKDGSEKPISKNEVVSLACCNKLYHRGCLDQWRDRMRVATCPTCRSEEKEFALKEEVLCYLCNKTGTNEDSIITVQCVAPVKVATKVYDWWQSGASVFSIPSLAAQALFYSVENVTHYFHDTCLRSYYSTEKSGHDNNFGEIIYFCPIHKESKVLLPKIGALQLPDKSHMTDEEVRLLAQKYDQIDLERMRVNAAIKVCGGMPIDWSPTIQRK